VEKTLENLILIVDDQADDQGVLAWGLRRLGVLNPIFCLQDGHEVIRYYNGNSPYGDRVNYPLPAILFLDLQLPVASGWAVLDWIQGLGLKRDTHIFAYSQLTNVNEVQRVYNLGADSFLKKPCEEIDLMNLIYHFPKFWKIKAPEPAEETASAPAKGETLVR
jgi:CheY-like chemotaxis protein